MKYEEMNNHQINKLVARKLGVEWIAVAQDGLIVDGKSASVDYCNNPSDAWPIIVENKISLITPDDGSFISEAVVVSRHLGYDDDEIHCEISFSVQHDNQLRAAMICFLKIKDAENGKH